MSGEENYMDKYKDKYLEEKFSRIIDDLGEIKHNTEKTNGSVARAFQKIGELEAKHRECPIGYVAEKQKTILQETEVARFFGKYPVFARIVASALIFSLVMNVVLILNKLKDII